MTLLTNNQQVVYLWRLAYSAILLQGVFLRIHHTKPTAGASDTMPLFYFDNGGFRYGLGKLDTPRARHPSRSQDILCAPF